MRSAVEKSIARTFIFVRSNVNAEFMASLMPVEANVKIMDDTWFGGEPQPTQTDPEFARSLDDIIDMLS